jgi:hypothetical protein
MSKLALKNADGTWSAEAKELFMVEKILKAIGSENLASNEKVTVTLEDKYAGYWTSSLAELKSKKAIKAVSVDRMNQLLYGYNALVTCKISLIPADFVKGAVKKSWQQYLISRLHERPVKKNELREVHGTDERLAFNDKHRQELIPPTVKQTEMIAPEDRCSSDFPPEYEFCSTSEVEYRI